MSSHVHAIQTRVRPDIQTAIADVATREGRSMSSAARQLLREALCQRGLLMANGQSLEAPRAA